MENIKYVQNVFRPVKSSQKRTDFDKPVLPSTLYASGSEGIPVSALRHRECVYKKHDIIRYHTNT